MLVCLYQRELGSQIFNHIRIARHLFAVHGLIAVVIILKALHEHNAAGIFISKQRDSCVHTLLQIAEADDIAKGFYAVQNTVGTTERLDEPVHFQILVHPQRVERCCVKACQEHIHYDEQIQFLVFHTERNILIVVLELIAGCIIVRMEHCMEIDKTLFDAFNGFELDDLSFLNETDRHYEHSELSEASLHKRMPEQGESIEDTILRQLENETLCLAIDALPEIQRRRLTMYYFGELTYEQIAEMEGCTKRAVKFSVDIAIEN